mgnify:CR=1 FL=1
MIQFNRETLMIVAVAVCLFTCFYLYKENQKQKLELSTFTSAVVSKLKQAPANDGIKQKPVVVAEPAVIVEENGEL